MAFTVVGSAGVEIAPEKARRFDAKLRTILKQVEKTAKMSLKTVVDTDNLVHQATAAVKRAGRQIPKLAVELSLRDGTVARLERQLKALNRLVPDLMVKVKLDLDGVAGDIRRLRMMIRDIDLDIDPDVDDAHARQEIRDLRGDVDSIDSTVNVDADTGMARAKMTSLSRSRIVSIIPVVKRSAFILAQQTLNALGQVTGIQSLLNSLRSLGQAINPMTAVRIGVLGASVTVLGSAAMVGTANLFSLVASLKALGGLAAPLPGLFAAAAVGAKTLGWAMEDIAVQAPELVEGWKALKVAVSENFWDTARRPIMEMANHLLPQLESAWSRTARTFGTEAGYFADAASRAFGGGFIEEFFGHLDAGVRAFRPALDPLLTGLADLVNFGASQLPALSRWASEVGTSIGQSLSRMTEDGTLQQVTDAGVAAARDLGRALQGLFGSLGGIARAATESGGATLTTLADGLQSLSDKINSAEFQTALVRMFTTSRETLDSFLAAAGPGLDKLFNGVMSTFNAIGPMIGDGLGQLVGSIGALLGSDSVQAGVKALFGGLHDAVEALAPVFKQLEPVVGSLFSILGDLASGVLAPLGEAFAGVLLGLLPAAQAFADLAVRVMPMLSDALIMVGQALGEALSDPALMETLYDLIVGLVDVVPQLVAALPTLLELIIGIGGFLVDVVIPALPTIISLMGYILPLVLGLAAGFKLVGVASAVGLAISGPVGWAIAAIAALVAAIALIVLNWDAVKEAVGTAVDWIGEKLGAFGDWMTGIRDRITEAFSNAGTWLLDAGRSIITGLMDGIRSLIPDLSAIGQTVLSWLPNGDSFGFGVNDISRPRGGPGAGNGGGFTYAPTINNPQTQSLSQELSRDANRAATYMPWA